MNTIPDTYRQESNGSCYLIDPKPIDYSAPYWGKNGRSTLEDQRFNVHGFQNEYGMTKSESVLLHCIGVSILEIGCAPGAFLRLAVEQGFDCVGIAPEKGLSQAINAYCGCPVIEGFFPDVALPGEDKSYDNIVAMDVFQRIQDGESFIENCMNRLNPTGRLILMIPILTDEDYFRPQDFNEEHVVIYHKCHLEEWLKPVIFDKWIDGHCIVVIEKPQPELSKGLDLAWTANEGGVLAQGLNEPALELDAPPIAQLEDKFDNYETEEEPESESTSDEPEEEGESEPDADEDNK